MVELDKSQPLIRFQWEGKTHPLGYLLDFLGRGVFDAMLGKVDVSSEEAVAHNRALEAFELECLDALQVNEAGMLYLKRCKSQVVQVITWLGTQVSEDLQVKGLQVTFAYRSKSYRGQQRIGDDSFDFVRIA